MGDAVVPHRLADFAIVREVGRGGMGIVYEAWQESLGRRVALKVIRTGRGDEGHLRDRFLREARAVARLHHSNIVPVFSAGEVGGRLYMAMQFIEGLPVDAVLEEVRRRRIDARAATNEFVGELADTLLFAPIAETQIEDPDEDTSPPVENSGSGTKPISGSTARTDGESASGYWRSVASMIRDAADGLQYAHEQGVLHRDVKPANLLLEASGRVWIADFGLAKAVDEPNLTATGDVLGTIRYMAPESFRGKAGPLVDVYALGLTLYELLALRPAFDAPTRDELLRRVMDENPTRLRTIDPAIPRDLETIVHKAIEREPESRYPSAGALRDDLRRFLDDEPVLARRPTLGVRLAKWAKRHRGIVRTASVAGVLGVLGLVVALLLINQQANVARRNAKDAEDNLALFKAERTEKERELERRLAALAREQTTNTRRKLSLALFAWREGNVVGADELLQSIDPAERKWTWRYLDRLCHGETASFQLPQDKGISWWSNQSRIDDRGSRVLYNLTGERTRPSNRFEIWDADLGERLCEFETQGPTGIATISGDGELVAVANLVDQEVEIRRARDGELLRSLSCEVGVFADPAFGADNTRLAIRVGRQRGVMDSRETIVVDTLDGREIARLPTNGDPALSADGKWVGFDIRNEPVDVWDVATGERRFGFPAMQDEWAYGPCVFDPTGRFAASTDPYGIQLLDLATGEPAGRIGEGRATFDFGPDGDLLVASIGNGFRLWDVQRQQVLREYRVPSTIRQVVFLPDGRHVRTLDEQGFVKTWDVSREQAAVVLPARSAMHAVPNRDGSELYVVQLVRSTFTRYVVDAGERRLGDHWDKGIPSHLALHPDERRVAIADGGSGEVWEYDVRTMEPLRQIPGTGVGTHMCHAEAVAYSPDGRLLASAGVDRVVLVRDRETGEVVHEFGGHTKTVTNVVFSRDGRLVNVPKYAVQIRSVEDGQVVHQLDGHLAHVGGIAFHPHDERLLATGDGSGVVKLWDIETGEEIVSLTGQGPRIKELSFSADGHRLVGVTEDELFVWDARPR